MERNGCWEDVLEVELEFTQNSNYRETRRRGWWCPGSSLGSWHHSPGFPLCWLHLQVRVGSREAQKDVMWEGHTGGRISETQVEENGVLGKVESEEREGSGGVNYPVDQLSQA